ncbi:glycosyltransferase [Nocardiopsis aegyptia]|uniref:Glycosyltransferase involved in cell wall biosynthesis n=1 Tax=Nocardiopsis aegyptia TaxID=220378 RepID=A0A7Z0J9U1_9ACTN|nr:glycosyltransferase [Nocardiopsis aegyptia]NYJ34067.1 glycosyltransferase involved in cell wall biosynthesis [Nocardiopsis aegyptia]
MRIAMVSEHASPLAAITGEDAGGQNVHVAELASALAALGHEVDVYTRRTDPDLPNAVSMCRGVRVIHVPAGPAAPIPKDDLPRHMPEFGRRLRAAWASERPDVVHAHFWMSGMASLDAAVPLALPVLQTFHALGTVKQRFQGVADTSPAERVRVERAVAAGCARVVATSTEERRELSSWGIPFDRVDVVPCGVDTRRFRPDGPSLPKDDRPRLLSLGRIVRRKGVDTVIRTLAKLPDAELVVAGGPDPRELDSDPEIIRLRVVADRYGVADRVRFLGCVARPDVPDLVRSADVAVNVPWYEPFGMSTVESMACGVPVVASRVGGHVDTVLHRTTGLLVPPRAPDRLARSVGELLADGSARRAFGAAAAARVRERYSWAEVARRTEQCYRSVVAETRRPVPRARAAHGEPVGTRGGEV